MTTVRAWVLASRPATLSAAAVPVAVGTAVATRAGHLSPGPALAALFGALAIQIGTNLANDVFDFEKGADTEERLGPTRAVQAGLLSPGQVRRGMWVAFLVAALFGLYLVAEAGPAILVIGLASIAAGVGYTAGPWPLAYLGLGDLFVMVFFGLVAVGGTVFVQVGSVPPQTWLAAVPVGALSTAILAVNNLRDWEQDERADKRTLAVRFGRRFAVGEYLLLLALAYAAPLIIGGYACLPLVTLPFALLLARRVLFEKGRALNPALVGTAQLLLAFGGLFAVGLVIP